MKTDFTTTSGPTIQRLKDLVQTAHQEIDELAVQFSLGKAEASERFEDIKRDLQIKSKEWKLSWENLSTEANLILQQKIDELQLKLALGKADAAEIYQAQKKGILQSFAEFESKVKANEELNEYYAEIKAEVEKLKLKLEYLT